MVKSASDFYGARQVKIDRERLAKIKKLRGAVTKFVSAFPDVKEIAIVGSVAKGEFYRGASDIDVVVKGLKVQDILKASSCLEKLLSMDVDLIPWEDLEMEHPNVLERRITVYEKK